MKPEKKKKSTKSEKKQCRKLQVCFFENPAQPAPKTWPYSA